MSNCVVLVSAKFVDGRGNASVSTTAQTDVAGTYTSVLRTTSRQLQAWRRQQRDSPASVGNIHSMNIVSIRLNVEYFVNFGTDRII